MNEPRDLAATKSLRWNAADYAANSVVQQTWARELIARLNLRGDEHVLDVGCGDGKVTAEIARAVPRGSRHRRGRLGGNDCFCAKDFSGEANIRIWNFRSWTRGKSEVSSAPVRSRFFQRGPALGGRSPGDFARRRASVLKPGGRLVVSCGGKGNAQDVFVALRPEMRLKRWRQFFRRMPKPYFFYSPADYEKWLPRSGFKTLNVRLVPKDAIYAGRDGFAAWLRTTWLPYVQRVPENLREEFIAAVADRYVAKHPPDAEGKVHVRMVRLEIDAVKDLNESRNKCTRKIRQKTSVSCISCSWFNQF